MIVTQSYSPEPEGASAEFIRWSEPQGASTGFLR
jgi:hypothetical protein